MVVLILGWGLFPSVVAQAVEVPSVPESQIVVEADGATTELATVFLFGRDDCGFCKKEKEWLVSEGIPFVYLNILTDPAAKGLYNQVVAKHSMSKVTPVTVIGATAFSGFNGGQITGKEMKIAIEVAKQGTIYTVADHLAQAPAQTVATGQGCDAEGCELPETAYTFDIPFGHPDAPQDPTRTYCRWTTCSWWRCPSRSRRAGSFRPACPKKCPPMPC